MQHMITPMPMKNHEGNCRYTLLSSSGVQVSVLAYGASLYECRVPNHDGCIENIVMNYFNIDVYEADTAYSGATVGPVAGRIKNGLFSFGEQSFTLTPNEGNNILHSGKSCLSKILWMLENIESTAHSASLTLSACLADGTEGFPGNRKFTTEYTLSESNDKIRLCQEFFAVTDKPTPVNMTNHAYFDLSGRFDGSVKNAVIHIPADHVLINDDENLPVCRIPVKDTEYDLRSPIALNKALMRMNSSAHLTAQRGFDNTYDMRGVSCATLTDEKSGRRMRVSGSGDALVFYSGGFLHQSPMLHSGTMPTSGCAIALEWQDFPNAQTLKLPFFILSPGNEHRAYMEWIFDTI